jgi:hypothetical protein
MSFLQRIKYTIATLHNNIKLKVVRNTKLHIIDLTKIQNGK